MARFYHPSSIFSGFPLFFWFIKINVLNIGTEGEKDQEDNGDLLTFEETLYNRYLPYWSMLDSSFLEILDTGIVYNKACICILTLHGAILHPTKLWGGEVRDFCLHLAKIYYESTICRKCVKMLWIETTISILAFKSSWFTGRQGRKLQYSSIRAHCFKFIC
jgi:hypothetical protein